MKKVLYVIIALSAVYIILAFFGPKQIKVERETIVNKPADAVKQKLSDFKFFHERWSPWTEKDPAMKTTYEGTPSTVGHFYTWNGNKKVGSGSMKIVSMKGDTIKEQLVFEGKGNSTVNLVAKDNGNNTTTVKWQMIMDIGFFGRTPMLFMNMDKMMGPDFEKGMANLKTALESSTEETQTAATTYEVKEIEWPEVNYIGTKKESVAIQDVPVYL
ncbi:MAG: SRPBCC family protein, partial [Bacteroidia bacterium]